MRTTRSGDSVIVTGASGGIGEQFARELARRGSDLLLVARNQLALDTLAGELRGAYPGIAVHTLAVI